jgi:hypothetical protein
MGNSLIKDWVWEKNSKHAFSPDFGKLMVPSESTPSELSNEWSCQ